MHRGQRTIAPHKKILVSACLIGEKCRYNGKALRVRILPDSDLTIPVCPEQLGGLPTPRPKSYFIFQVAVARAGYPRSGSQRRAKGRCCGNDVLKGKAKVVNEYGEDITKKFISGGMKVLRLCRKHRIKEAYLKSGSPSCGKDGVTSALLKKYNIKVKWVK